MRLLALSTFGAPVLVTSTHPLEETAGLHQRYIPNPYGVHCAGDKNGDKKNLAKAIKYLRETRIKEEPLSKGPGQCQTASCAKEAKITRCNEKTESATGNWTLVANAAEQILDECKRGGDWSQG
ncbi:hypothetical protein BDW74DRAFT_163618 [Aspergillus multicolor]|uniref:uncharacterized protein n=1 Tax=Aspergillus multicolor TaxID=41759 RepID=UPI003CCD6D87